MKRIFWLVVAGIALVIAVFTLYLLLWPVEIDPAAWTPPQALAASGVYAVNDHLSQIEKLAEGYIGPESVAIGSDGDLYTGLFDGRILRISPDGKTIAFFAEAR